MNENADYIRGREDLLRELASTGGLPQGRLSLELLYLIPPEFRDQYVRLFWEALIEPGTGTSYGSSNSESGSGGYDGRGGEFKGQSPRAHRPKGIENQGRVFQVGSPSGGGKRYRESWVIKNERALKKKDEIDRAMLVIAKDLDLFFKNLHARSTSKIPEAGQSGLTCSGPAGADGSGGCGRFMQKEWRFCPGCGKPRERRQTPRVPANSKVNRD